MYSRFRCSTLTFRPLGSSSAPMEGAGLLGEEVAPFLVAIPDDDEDEATSPSAPAGGGKDGVKKAEAGSAT